MRLRGAPPVQPRRTRDAPQRVPALFYATQGKRNQHAEKKQKNAHVACAREAEDECAVRVQRD